MIPLFEIACSRCGQPYPRQSADGLPATCAACDGFWEYREGLAWRPPDPRSGLRAWAGLFGLRPDELPDRALCRPLVRLGNTLVSQQGTPTAPGGSFKERGAEVLAAACLRRGVREVFLDSSGNAGIAMARAAADRGIACRVLVPESTPVKKLKRLEALRARVDVVPGDRRATHEAAQTLLHQLPYASHIVQPFFQAGVATMAWDLAREVAAADDGPRAGAGRIEHVLLPAGNGSLLLGLALGFDRLARAGRIDRVPRLHAVQLSGYATLSPAGPGVPGEGAPRAAGIAIADPPRRLDMLQVIERSGGDVIVVMDDDVDRAREALRREGLTTDPTGATAWAGLAKRQELAGSGTVVLLTSIEA